MKKQGITVAYIYNASFSLRVFIGFWNESKGFFHLGFLLTCIFRGVVPDAVFFRECLPSAAAIRCAANAYFMHVFAQEIESIEKKCGLL